jgi:VWFA-related protein
MNTPMPAGFTTNRPEPERNAAAIVVDMLNVGASAQYGQTAVRGLLVDYLNALPANTFVGLYRLTETRPIEELQPLTQRLELLRARIETMDISQRTEMMRQGIRPQFGGGSELSKGGMAAMEEAEARQSLTIDRGIQQRRMNLTFAALGDLGHHLAGISGRKSLIWITNGLPMKFDNVVFVDEIRRAAQQLANQGIAVYMVSTGLRAGVDTETEKGMFSVVANVTGGRSIFNSNDLSFGLQAASRDQRGTYTIGFYADDQPNDRWHSLRVETTRRDIELQHRQGYLAMRRAQRRSWIAKDWNIAATRQLDSTEIRLNGRAVVEGKQAVVSLQIDASDLYFQNDKGKNLADLEVGLAEKAANDATNIRVQPIEISRPNSEIANLPKWIPLTTTWPVNNATVTLVVIVRDRATNRHGSIELRVSER